MVDEATRMTPHLFGLVVIVGFVLPTPLLVWLDRKR